MTPAPLQFGQAPSELALNSAGLTRLAFANALRIGSSSPVYVAGLLRRDPRIPPSPIDTPPSRRASGPAPRELFPEPPPGAAGGGPGDQRALAGARHTGDHGQHAERDVDVDVAQVVGVGAAD